MSILFPVVKTSFSSLSDPKLHFFSLIILLHSSLDTSNISEDTGSVIGTLVIEVYFLTILRIFLQAHASVAYSKSLSI
ncbi:unnamed protein product [Meloidogyne enterolobii]|uniref:Uncharacterized protein n=1 Tax=Meloidogyne enterolobii TaxID=390850 RepID=A0ACB0ZAL8_MELEN